MSYNKYGMVLSILCLFQSINLLANGNGQISIIGNSEDNVCFNSEGNGSIINIGTLSIMEGAVDDFESTDGVKSFEIQPPDGFEFTNSGSVSMETIGFSEEHVFTEINATTSKITFNYNILNESDFGGVVIKNVKIKRVDNVAQTSSLKLLDNGGKLLPSQMIELGEYVITKYDLGINTTADEFEDNKVIWCEGNPLKFFITGGDGVCEIKVYNDEDSKVFHQVHTLDMNEMDLPFDFDDKLYIYGYDYIDGCEFETDEIEVIIDQIPYFEFSEDTIGRFTNDEKFSLEEYVINEVGDGIINVEGEGVVKEIVDGQTKHFFMPSLFENQEFDGAYKLVDVEFERVGTNCDHKDTLEVKVYSSLVTLTTKLCAYDGNEQNKYETFTLKKLNDEYPPDQFEWFLELQGYKNNAWQLPSLVTFENKEDNPYLESINDQDQEVNYQLNKENISAEGYSQLKLLINVANNNSNEISTIGSTISNIIYPNAGGFIYLEDEYCRHQEQKEIYFKTTLEAENIFVYHNGNLVINNSPVIKDEDSDDWILNLNKVSMQNQKSIELRLEYINENLGCNSTISQIITINNRPAILSIQDVDYCVGDNVIPVNFSEYNAEGSTFTWYKTSDLVDDNIIGVGNEFTPPVDTSYPHDVIVYITQTIDGCESLSNPVKFIVHDTPEINLKELPTNTFCNTPGEAFDLTPYLMDTNVEEGGFRALMLIGDGIEGDTLHNNLLIPSQYPLGAYILRYFQTTEHGCLGVDDTEIEIINWKPSLQVSYTDPCLGQKVEFKNNTTIDQDLVTYWKWEVEGEVLSNSKDFSHTFNTPGVYAVTLSLMTVGLCTNDTTVFVSVFPEFILTDDSPYLEQFENNNHFWVESGQSGRGSHSSWKIGSINGDIINGEANYWVTENGSGSYNGNERSWVESPCFDLSGLDKPMLSFQYNIAMQEGVDGIVLEYTLDNGYTWNTLGDQGAGINWYNARGITTTPGAQGGASVGWTGTTVDSTWQIARVDLNDVRLASLDHNHNVRFRFALASNENNPNNIIAEGFAFDDFFIGNRNQNILIEHFTNIHDNSQDLFLENWMADKNDVVVINYHIDVPGTEDDPLYIANTAPPTARALHHGNNGTNNAIMNGMFISDLPFNKWGTEHYDDQKLREASFSIDIGLQADNIIAQIKRIENIIDHDSIESVLTVHTAIVEKSASVAGIEAPYTLKTLLPNAAGIKFSGNWPIGEQKEFKQPINVPLEAGKEYMAIVFVEGARSKQIYQVGFKLFIGKQGNDYSRENNTIVMPLQNSFTLWPNPAQDYVNINFIEQQEQLSYSIVDARGNTILNGQQQDTKQLNINIESLKPGLFMIRLYSKQLGNVTKAIVVNK